MQKRTLKVALLAALAIILVLSFSSVALADQTWTDLPDTVTAKYGVTDNQVASISEGYGSLWKPYQAITRAQFTKMAVAAFGINLANPATASFTDVPKTDFYYQYIEGAKAAGVINGTTATTFSPKANITRQQAIAIVSRFVAMKNGYNLATMYAAEQIDHILAHFGDAASISADLKAEVAFAFDMGLTKGDAYGNVAPLANLMRIQAAAFLLRAQGLVPPANYTPAKIELVSADKSENLIGTKKAVTFKVTDAAGHPAAGVLVDFDVLYSNALYVGNIEPEAATTNNFGEVTVNLVSAEPGTERVSAAVAGVSAIYTTAYWVALDEVYITDLTREAENNANDPHEWSARVVVFGPGPRSTSAQDWYNAISTAPFDPSDINAGDGVDAGDYSYYLDKAGSAAGSLGAAEYYDSYDDAAWDYAYEKHLLAYYDLKPRVLPGIDVNWAITDYYEVDSSHVKITNADITPCYGPLAGGNYVAIDLNDYSQTVTSVKFGSQSAAFEQSGSTVYARVPKVTVAKIVSVTVTTKEDGTSDYGQYQYIDTLTKVASVGDITAVDGTAITPAKTAVGKTNADGISTIKIESKVTGKTYVQAVADYAGNPYPKQLFTHGTFDGWIWHDVDWSDQPAAYATAVKTWIPHVIGDNTAPITAASYTDNTGEIEKFTLTLKDTFGNVIPGYTVQWWIQGVGQFKSDGTSWSGLGEQNKEVDVTDVNGQSVVYVTSEDPGQTILHCKVMDKYGLPYHEWNVVKQWYAIDQVSFLPTLDPDGEVIPAVNLVGTSHTFTAQVSGLKWVFTIYDINQNGLSDDQVLLGNRADLKAVAGDVLDYEGEVDYAKAAGVDLPVGKVLRVEGIDGENYYFTRTADINLTGAEYWAPAAMYYDSNDDVQVVKAVWSGLAGKNVWFYNNIGEMALGDDGGWNVDETTLSSIPQTVSSINGYPAYVGKITAPTTLPVVTDAKGQAAVTITSNAKGWEFVFAVADYKDNPQYGDPTDPANWDELRYAFAVKKWVVSGGTVQPDIVTFNQTGKEGVSFINPVDPGWAGYGLQGSEQASSELVDGQLNPNYDVLGVAVFDEYGNALPGYRVQFEIIDQGKTDGTGAKRTYRPYTHFSDAEQEDGDSYITLAGIDTVGDADLTDFYDYGHSNDDASDEYGDQLSGKEGVFDRGRYTDANPLWDSTDDSTQYGRYDDDKAVGYTMNGAIDGAYDYACAAYAVLVLDQSYAELETALDDNNATKAVTRINIQVWSPTGALVEEYKVDKEWSLDAPALTTLSLLMTEQDDYTGLATSLTTDVDPVYIQVNALDQFGRFITGLTGDVWVKVTMGSSYTDYVQLTESLDGIWQGEFSPANGTGTYSLTPFFDTDASGTITSGELKGATRTLKWTD